MAGYSKDEGKCSNWEAILDKQPPRPARLRVTGQCEFPTAGYTVKLKRADPQGINPDILLLEKVVQEPKGQVAQVVTTVDVRYDEDPAQRDYTHVDIQPVGRVIEVQVVH